MEEVAFDQLCGVADTFQSVFLLKLDLIESKWPRGLDRPPLWLHIWRLFWHWVDVLWYVCVISRSTRYLFVSLRKKKTVRRTTSRGCYPKILIIPTPFLFSFLHMLLLLSNLTHFEFFCPFGSVNSEQQVVFLWGTKITDTYNCNFAGNSFSSLCILNRHALLGYSSGNSIWTTTADKSKGNSGSEGLKCISTSTGGFGLKYV